jgi:hypothetical protein
VYNNHEQLLEYNMAAKRADVVRDDIELEIDPGQIEQLAALFAQIDEAVTRLSLKVRRTSDIIGEITHNYRLANKALGHNNECV